MRCVNEEIQAGPAEIVDAAATPEPMQGLALFEVDDFRHLETLFGDRLGTSLLQAIDARVIGELPAGAGYWHAGRGRFAVNLGGTTAEAVRQIARRIQRRIAAAPLVTDAGDVAVTVSAGCALVAADDLARLGPAALDALRDAREAGRGRCRILAGAESMDQSSRLLQRAVDVVEHRGLAVVAQPVRRLNGTGRPAYLEMLARLPDEGAPLIEAAEFLPGVIGRGFGPAVDRQMLERALDLLTFHPRLRLAVNVSAPTLGDDGWDALLHRRSAVDLTLAERLIVEVPEAAVLADPAMAGRFLERVRSTGATLVLDGFGQGDITMRDLRAFRFDMAKIGGALMRAAGSDAAAQERIGTLCRMARRFEMAVIATGLEAEAEREAARDAGIDLGQGRLLGPPQEIAGLLEMAGAARTPPERVSPFRGSAFRVASASP